MKLIAITGGIGSGKTTVANIFKNLGFTILDADKVARDVVEPGTHVLEEIKNTFGLEIMDGNHLNRRKLGSIVFQDPNKLNVLNSIMQPAIAQTMQLIIDYYKNSGTIHNLIIDIPLLFERKKNEEMDVNIVVNADLETRINRIINRDNLTEEQAIQRIKAQMPLEEKVKMADVVFENNNETIDLEKAVKQYIKIEQLKP
ncbi:MAG: dephospho-CoA kinase [Lactobacillaceae bacterium]|jgi:dephospho-CoA kinase|nr:dephospho-CoA kinase [Lactobacillaceae bacterium]